MPLSANGAKYALIRVASSESEALVCTCGRELVAACAPIRHKVSAISAIFGAALIGGVIGFLWFNAHPAEVFMGDTGAMALGGALAGYAILTKTEVLLIFIGGIYAVVALSVIIQVVSFKRTGKRVFLMAPIQHHFEMKAWSETKIMVRFCIVCAILCAIGFVLYYRYYLRFRL